MKKIFTILNPVAGNGKASVVREALTHYFPSSNWDLAFYETTGEESIPEIVQDALANGVDLVIGAGGDGTVSAVADGLINQQVPLGIVPVGTANSLAQSLQIPLDPEAACRLLSAETRIRELDVLEVNGRYFVLQLGTGLDAMMIENTSREDKNKLGALAYIKSMFQQAVGFQPQQFTLTVDGRRHEVRASEIMVANAPDVGVLGLKWGQHIQPDDGQVDICIIRSQSLADYASVIWHFLRGQQPQASHIHYLTASDTLTIDASSNLSVQGDGEPLGSIPVTAKVIPSSLQVLVSAS